MADMAAAGGIGQGLLTFADYYQKGTQLKQQNALNQQAADVAKQNSQAGLLKSGMETNPDTGDVQYTPAQQQINDAQRSTQLQQSQLAGDENDPDSDASKTTEALTRQRIEKLQPGAGKMVPAGKSAAFYKEQYGDFLPEQEKLQGAVNVAKTKGEYSLDNTSLKNQGSGNKQQSSAWQKVQQMLESQRGNPAVGQAEKDLYATQKFNSLLQGRDPNDLSNQELSLVAGELGKAATGGVPTGHEQDALRPGTAEAGLSSVYSKFSNNPTPANAGAFVKQYKNYMDKIGSDAQKVITDKYGRIIESNKDAIGPDYYQKAQEQYIGRFKTPASDDSSSQKGLLQKSGGANASGAGGLKVGTVINGHKYLGGDTKDPKNWE